MLHSVFIIILYQTLSWCQISGKIFIEIDFFENFTVIQTHRYIAFQEAYQEDFEYSDFFRDHWLQSLHIGDVRRELICCGLDSGLEIGSCFQSKSITTNTRASELQSIQSFEPRYENLEHC